MQSILDSPLAHLENERALLLLGSLESSNHCGRRGDIDGGDSKLLLVAVLEEGENIVADDDTGLALKDVLAGRHVLRDCMCYLVKRIKSKTRW